MTGSIHHLDAAAPRPVPLLLTKFQVPPASPTLVPRPALVARLDEGAQCRLTLLVAPAGYGKTTLLSHWLREHCLPAAWVSLDSGDDDPRRFWRYVLAALEQASPGVGQAALALLLGPASPLEPVLTTLINSMSVASEKMVLVLDDYQLIHSSEIHSSLAFLLEHLPPQLSLIIASRAVPPLPLPRLRARGHLLEVRAEALRFTPDETAALLGHMALPLSADEVDALCARTEGWAAALQLVTLTLRCEGMAHAGLPLEEWLASHPHLQSYLAQEVLQAQPPAFQAFLLQTSILPQF